ncbi:hypothetical protein RHS01_11419 [Rhizoctonia solani]|uniref:Uncharacterized protein n=1 Tax=Rhizoctonia solani TaxID=456999 RepID=A0A8H7I068_9AGAM|nr:hypothetical protein RHS01_11419 [Rhizoctonia solani]
MGPRRAWRSGQITQSQRSQLKEWKSQQLELTGVAGATWDSNKDKQQVQQEIANSLILNIPDLIESIVWISINDVKRKALVDLYNWLMSEKPKGLQGEMLLSWNHYKDPAAEPLFFNRDGTRDVERESSFVSPPSIQANQATKILIFIMYNRHTQVTKFMLDLHKYKYVEYNGSMTDIERDQANVGTTAFKFDDGLGYNIFEPVLPQTKELATKIFSEDKTDSEASKNEAPTSYSCSAVVPRALKSQEGDTTSTQPTIKKAGSRKRKAPSSSTNKGFRAT